MAGQDWDVGSEPADHLLVSLIPQKIRDLKSATKTVIQKEHVALSTANSGGQHSQGSARVYMVDSTLPTTDPESENLATSATGDDGRLAIATGIGTNTIKIYIATSAGISTGWKGVMVADAGTAARVDLANNAYVIGRNAAGSGDVNVIKLNANDVPEILVGAVLSADTAPSTGVGIANRKYVLDQVVSIGTIDSGIAPESAAIQATTDGFFVGTVKHSSGNGSAYITGFSDGNADPTTVLGYASIAYSSSYQSSSPRANSFCIAVKSGDYYKATFTNANGTPTATRDYHFIPIS